MSIRPWKLAGRLVALGVVASTAVLAPVVLLGQHAADAASIALPDLEVLVPTSAISVGTNPSTGHRQLQFTHVTWDAGTGPFAIQPHYAARTGLSSFSQVLYRSAGPGHWTPDHAIPLAVDGIFQPPSDYRYPLTRFTLNAVAPDGGLGGVIRVSPKVDYCITGDTFVGGVPNAPPATTPPQSNCTDPHRLLGFSVGWGDQYDQTDSGQPIDLTGVANGTYILRATVDPQHLFTERSRTNDVVDTKLTIAGSTVTVDSQTRPSIVPPTVALTSPMPGAIVKGAVALTARASASAPATVTSVQFLLDGLPIGPRLTTSPFHVIWSSGAAPGAHTVSAQVTDSMGTVGTAPVETVHFVRARTPGLAVDVLTSTTSHGAARTAAFSTGLANDTLVAFAALDGPQSSTQTTRVTGAGLRWHLVRRSDAQAGDAEIWSAHASGVLHHVHVTSTPHVAGYAQQLTVVAFSGSSGLGAAGASSAPSGPASVTITTKGTGSDIYAVGSDWDRAIPRLPEAGQSILRQWVDASDGDTFWLQGLASKGGAAGERVAVDDVAPTGDRFDMAAVEVRAAPPPPASVVFAAPASGEAVSETTPIAVAVRDAVPVRSARLLLDGHPLGSPSSSGALRTFNWDTRRASNGTHRLSSVVVDEVGRQRHASVTIVVANPRPAMTCFVLQAVRSASGAARVTVPLIHVAAAGDRYVALVRGGRRAASTAVSSSPRIRWHLVREARGPAGVLAVWTAVAPRGLQSLRVTSWVTHGSQDLSVLAIEGTSGVAATTEAQGYGPRSVSLRTARAPSLVLVVGVGRTAGSRAPRGWVSLDRSGGPLASWVQYTNEPALRTGTRVVVSQVRSVRGPWGAIAVELPGDDG